MPLPAPSCPRCGYDMTGVVESWRDACPLAGRCSECGLDFSWSALLNPTLSVPLWSFEHTGRRRARCWLSTALRTALPHRFWTAIRIEHPIRSGRLGIFVILIVLLAHSLCSLAVASLVFIDVLALTTSGDEIAAQTALAALVPYAPWGWNDVFLAYNAAWFLVVMSLVMPLPFLVLSDTFSLARVRFVHLLRAWSYSQPVIWSITLLSLGGGLAEWWRFRYVATVVPLCLQTIGVIWLMVYWWRACTRYLHLPRPGIVLTLMTVITILAAIAWMVYLQPVVADWFERLGDMANLVY